MIFLVQFGRNKHLQIFQRPQSELALRARALLLVFEKFTCAYLFQIALEMRLPIYSHRCRTLSESMSYGTTALSAIYDVVCNGF